MFGIDMQMWLKLCGLLLLLWQIVLFWVLVLWLWVSFSMFGRLVIYMWCWLLFFGIIVFVGIQVRKYRLNWVLGKLCLLISWQLSMWVQKFSEVVMFFICSMVWLNMKLVVLVGVWVVMLGILCRVGMVMGGGFLDRVVVGWMGVFYWLVFDGIVMYNGWIVLFCFDNDCLLCCSVNGWLLLFVRLKLILIVLLIFI